MGNDIQSGRVERSIWIRVPENRGVPGLGVPIYWGPYCLEITM